MRRKKIIRTHKVQYKEGKRFLEKVLRVQIANVGFKVENDSNLPPGRGHNFFIENVLCTNVKYVMTSQVITMKFNIRFERLFQYAFQAQIKAYWVSQSHQPIFRLDLTEEWLRPHVWAQYTGRFVSERFHGCTNGMYPMSRLAYLFRINRQPFDYPMKNKVPLYQLQRRFATITKIMVKMSVHPMRDHIVKAIDDVGAWKKNVRAKHMKQS